MQNFGTSRTRSANATRAVTSADLSSTWRAPFYRLNDERSRLKKAINLASGSRLVEEKSYSFYHSKGGDQP